MRDDSTSTVTTLRPNYPVKFEDCVANAGHCWVADDAQILFAVRSGKYTITETCKHCGAWRTGTSQPSMTYTEPQPREVS